MTTVLLFLAVLSFLIAIHEAGHLASAKLSGVWVHEYSIGFGPSLLSKKIRETTYHLKPIPFGGYVKMAGEDVGEGEERDEEVPEDRKFYSQSPVTKMLISVSGPTMNVLAAVLIMILVVGATGTPRVSIYGFMENSPAEEKLSLGDQIISIGGENIVSTGQIDTAIKNQEGGPVSVTVYRGEERKAVDIEPRFYEEQGKYMLGVKLGTAMTNVITQVTEDSLPTRVGLKQGDKITAINGEPVKDAASIVHALEGVNEGEEITLQVKRNDNTLSLSATPEKPEEVITGFSLKTIRDPVGPLTAIKQGLNQIKTIIVLTYQGIRMIIRGQIAAGEAVTGPVGIANILGQSARQGFYSLFFMISLISLNLGLINLVPFPALDGSRIGYATYELIRGKPIPPEKEGLINSIGFFILIGLMLFITYRDIIKFFT
ncbi:RIP metalloprotease RseP [Candidatus Bipolaricaulota bacterium]|nr:RIP metalloprotease RseP [Candidatus Bipolaricaulota bacterium]